MLVLIFKNLRLLEGQSLVTSLWSPVGGSKAHQIPQCLKLEGGLPG